MRCSPRARSFGGSTASRLGSSNCSPVIWMMYPQGVVILKRNKLSLHSLADSICKLGFGNVAGRVGMSRSITTNRHNLLGSGLQSGIKSIQQQIINALRLGERGKASNMLLGLGHQNCSIKSDDFMEILKYCASLPDPLFAIDTWHAMVEKKIDLNERCFLLVMRALCNGGYLEEATNMINLSEDGFGLHDSLSMYNSLLRACLKVQSTDLVNQCLDLMERRMIGKNEVTYLELLKFAVQQQNLLAVNEIWKDYIKLYSPSMISLQSLIWSFARLGDLGSAYEKLQYMVALGIQGDVCIFRTLKVGLHSSRLDIPIPANDGLGLQKMDLGNYFSIPFEQQTCTYDRKEMTNFDLENRETQSVETIGLTKHLSKPAMRVLSLSFNILMHACGRVQNCELAEKLMMQVQKLGLQPSSHAYDGLIRAVAAKRGCREGMKVLRIMQQHNLKPLDSTLAALAVGCCKATELDLAEALLDQISNCPFAYPYNAFLDACEKMDQRERAVRMLTKMKQLKVRPDIRTYELMFLLFGAVDSPYQKADLLTHEDIAKRIKAIEMDMACNGIQHSHCSMKYLMKALGEAGMIKELLQYLGKAEDLFCRSKLYLLRKDAFLGTPIYNKVLHSLVEARENHWAFEMFKSMKSKDFWPDGNTYNIMIQCCVDRKHKFAFSLLSQMLRDGFFPTDVTYTSLVKIPLKNGNFEETWNILNRARRDGIVFDIQLYNNILHEARHKGRIDIIELLVEQMYHEKVLPDTTTCRCIFYAYIKQELFSTAVEALQVMAMRMICQGDETCEGMKDKFEEDYILSEDSEAELRIVKLFKGHEDIVFTLLSLRWCAMLGFPISWLPNQSLWARRLSANYEARQSHTMGISIGV